MKYCKDKLGLDRSRPSPSCSVSIAWASLPLKLTLGIFDPCTEGVNEKLIEISVVRTEGTAPRQRRHTKSAEHTDVCKERGKVSTGTLFESYTFPIADKSFSTPTTALVRLCGRA